MAIGGFVPGGTDRPTSDYLKALHRRDASITAWERFFSQWDILVCPVCKTRVELLADESGLKCVSCRRVYPIRDDSPVMLVDEAKIEE